MSGMGKSLFGYVIVGCVYVEELIQTESIFIEVQYVFSNIIFSSVFSSDHPSSFDLLLHLPSSSPICLHDTPSAFLSLLHFHLLSLLQYDTRLILQFLLIIFSSLLFIVPICLEDWYGAFFWQYNLRLAGCQSKMASSSYGGHSFSSISITSSSISSSVSSMGPWEDAVDSSIVFSIASSFYKLYFQSSLIIFPLPGNTLRPVTAVQIFIRNLLILQHFNSSTTSYHYE